MLVIRSANIETPFLPESELPIFARPIHAEDFDESKAINGSKSSSSNPVSSIINLLKKLIFSFKVIFFFFYC